jgi:hypothetical protein
VLTDGPLSLWKNAVYLAYVCIKIMLFPHRNRVELDWNLMRFSNRRKHITSNNGWSTSASINCIQQLFWHLATVHACTINQDKHKKERKKNTNQSLFPLDKEKEPTNKQQEVAEFIG